jgi:hypothetical protein
MPQKTLTPYSTVLVPPASNTNVAAREPRESLESAAPARIAACIAAGGTSPAIQR